MYTYDDLTKRRDRAIATLLSFKETECDRHLPIETSVRLRKLILDQINDLFIVATSAQPDPQPEFVLNDLFLERLDAIENKVSLLVERS